MGDFVERVTNTRAILHAAQTAYNTYSTQVTTTDTSSEQLANLNHEKLKLNSQIANIRKISDTYNREYLDRSTSVGFWNLRGVSTLQDWVLLAFFGMYGLVILLISMVAVMYSRTPVYSVGIVVILGIILAIMMTAVIMRFA